MNPEKTKVRERYWFDKYVYTCKQTLTVRSDHSIYIYRSPHYMHADLVLTQSIIYHLGGQV